MLELSKNLRNSKSSVCIESCLFSWHQWQFSGESLSLQRFIWSPRFFQNISFWKIKTFLAYKEHVLHILHILNSKLYTYGGWQLLLLENINDHHKDTLTVRVIHCPTLSTVPLQNQRIPSNLSYYSWPEQLQIYIKTSLYIDLSIYLSI